MSGNSYKRGPFWCHWHQLDDDRISFYAGVGITGIVGINFSTNAGVQIYLGRQPSEVFWGDPWAKI